MTSTTTIKNNHPTLKPLSLNKYLSNMILPPKRENDNRKILVPFSGVSSEMIGAMLAGWDEIHGFEYEKDYIEIANARLDYWRIHDLETYKEEEVKKKKEKFDRTYAGSWITNKDKEN